MRSKAYLDLFYYSKLIDKALIIVIKMLDNYA